jgi:hypothetical protein
MDDKLIDALDWAIACLSTKKHEDDKAMVAVLKAHLDEVCSRKVVGELDGKPVRVGDVLAHSEYGLGVALADCVMVPWEVIVVEKYKDLRWPTKADFGVKE